MDHTWPVRGEERWTMMVIYDHRGEEPVAVCRRSRTRGDWQNIRD